MTLRPILPFLLAITLTAQGIDPGVIRVTTRLVEISVIVRDRNGPVKGLTKDDFTLFDKGREQKVAFFSVTTSTPVARPEPAAAPPSAPHTLTFTNHLEQRAHAPTSATVILLDGINTEWRDQVYAKEQFIKYLSQIRPDDRIAVYVLGARLFVLNDFTSDAKRLVAALARYKGQTLGMLDASTPEPADTGDAEMDAILNQGNGMIADAAIVNRVENTTAAMEAIANHLAKVPGRKNLIWILGSFPFAIGLDSPDSSTSDQVSSIGGSGGSAAYGVNSRDGSPARTNRNFRTEISRASVALNNANIAVYPVDARGLMAMPKSLTAEGAVPKSRGRAIGPPPTVSFISTGHTSSSTLAESTGGILFENSNDIRGAIRAAVEDSEVSYTLGFYPDSGLLDSKFHPIKVTVKGHGLDVRYRKGYLALPETQAADHQRLQQIRDAIWSPLEATGISLTAALQKVEQPKPGSLEFVVGITPGDIGFVQKDGKWTTALDIVFAQRGQDGRDLGFTTKSVAVNLDQARTTTLCSAKAFRSRRSSSRRPTRCRCALSCSTAIPGRSGPWSFR